MVLRVSYFHFMQLHVCWGLARVACRLARVACGLARVLVASDVCIMAQRVRCASAEMGLLHPAVALLNMRCGIAFVGHRAHR